MVYQTPEVRDLGRVEQVTQGQNFSTPDGDSGTTGNRGGGKQGGGPPPGRGRR
jgi:hypothetical protein